MLVLYVIRELALQDDDLGPQECSGLSSSECRASVQPAEPRKMSLEETDHKLRPLIVTSAPGSHQQTVTVTPSLPPLQDVLQR